MDAEHHVEDEPEIDGDGRIEGDAEAERPHIRVVVVADPEQHAPHDEQHGEDDERAGFLERAVKRKTGIADEIENELLDRVEDETVVNVDGRIGLWRAADEHRRIEPLRGDDADGEDRRQDGEDRILDDQRNAVADRPGVRRPMPDELGNAKEGSGKHPIAEEDENEGPLPRIETKDFDAGVASRRRTALGMLSLLDGPLHVSLVPA